MFLFPSHSEPILSKWNLVRSKTFWMISVVVLSLLAFVLLFQTVVLLKSLQDPSLASHRQSLETNAAAVTQTLQDKTSEYNNQKVHYDELVQQILPTHLTSDMMLQALDKLVMASGYGLVLNKVDFQDTETRPGFTLHPVKVSIMGTKDGLLSFVSNIEASGLLRQDKPAANPANAVVLPLMDIEQMTVEGDMGDLYDAAGNVMHNAVTTNFVLRFYEKTK